MEHCLRPEALVQIMTSNIHIKILPMDTYITYICKRDLHQKGAKKWGDGMWGRWSQENVYIKQCICNAEMNMYEDKFLA